MFPVAPLGFPRGWIHFGPGEYMQKVSNLYLLYGLGHTIGQLSNNLGQPKITFGHIVVGCGLVYVELNHLLAGVPVQFESTARVMKEFVQVLDSLKAKYEANPATLWGEVFTGTADHRKLIDLITQLEVQLMNELDALPIWFVTARRAYSVDVLINNAEKILDPGSVSLLSPRSLKDIREAGRAIAFELPTAAGFHSVRAVEGVARGYYAAIGGLRPTDDAPLGPGTNEIRNQRDALQAAGKIDKEDLIHIVIETLARLNNVYRKPIAHPDMILELPAAMSVFDSAKCAIELMLEDAQKKHTAGPIPPGFF